METQVLSIVLSAVIMEHVEDVFGHTLKIKVAYSVHIKTAGKVYHPIY